MWRALSRVALALWLLASAPAAAFTLIEDPFEGDELSIGGSVKSFFFGMHGGMLDLPLPGLESPAAQGLLVLRPTLEAQIGETWRLAVHYNTTATASSLALDSAGTGVVVGRAAPPPRFLPLAGTPVEDGGFQWRHALDWFWVRGRFGPVDVTVGRQPITMGRASFWPTLDLLATFTPTEIDKEYKPGVDALRLDIALSHRHTLTLVAVGGEREGDHDAELSLAGSAFAARVKLGFPSWELGGFAGYVRRDGVFGLDAFVDLEKVSLHAEAALTWVPDEARAADDGELYARATAGVTWSIPTFKLIGEFHYNGQGAADAEGYLAKIAGPRFTVGELYTPGRYYAGVAADWETHPLVHLTLAAMANLRDPSVLLTPGLSYSAAANVELVAGAMIPLGRDMDGLRARSEFGLYPYFGYLELRLAL